MFPNGNFQSVVSQASGPNSGNFRLDGTAFNYSNLEPITLGGTLANLVISGTPAADTIVVSDDPGVGTMRVTAVGTMESIGFNAPTNSLTINAGAGIDTVTFASVDPAFNAALIVHGDGDQDAIIVPPAAVLNTHAGGITFFAEAILIGAPSSPAATVQTAGDIVFAAANSLGTLATPDAGATPVVLATVNINNAAISGARTSRSRPPQRCFRAWPTTFPQRRRWQH